MLANDVVRSVRRIALRDAATSAVVNCVLNWFAYRTATQVPLTVDSIASREPTLFSRSIPGALFLCAILGTIAWFKFRRHGRTIAGVDTALLDRPYFFSGFKAVLFNTTFAFGLLIAIGVILQARMGTLYVSPISAIAIATLISAASGFFITYSTMRAQLRAE